MAVFAGSHERGIAVTIFLVDVGFVFDEEISNVMRALLTGKMEH